MKVYYAHGIYLYGSSQEETDIATMEKMGFKVINPNQKELGERYFKLKAEHGFERAFKEVFYPLIDEADALIFRGSISGKITSGVYKEIQYALLKQKPILELPTMLAARRTEVQETMEIILQSGHIWKS